MKIKTEIDMLFERIEKHIPEVETNLNVTWHYHAIKKSMLRVMELMKSLALPRFDLAERAMTYFENVRLHGRKRASTDWMYFCVAVGELKLQAMAWNDEMLKDKALSVLDNAVPSDFKRVMKLDPAMYPALSSVQNTTPEQIEKMLALGIPRADLGLPPLPEKEDNKTEPTKP